jgi:ADP-heptose:LPS heptosyltransferase
MKSPRLSYEFAPPETVAETVAGQRLVICGNTGIGWVAAAVGTPLIAFEKADAMAFGEYSFEKCGVESLRMLITEPSVEQAMRAVVAELERE